MLERVRQEPVLVVAVVQALLVALAAFGLQLTQDQLEGIMGIVSALIAATALWTRTQTRSKRSLEDEGIISKVGRHRDTS